MVGGVACNCCVRLRTINEGTFLVPTNALAELLNRMLIINVVNQNVLMMLLFMLQYFFYDRADYNIAVVGEINERPITKLCSAFGRTDQAQCIVDLTDD